MSSVLKVEKVTKSFSRNGATVTAITEANLDVSKSEFVALRGPSGSGKTTLLLCAGGLLSPESGSVSIEEMAVYSLDSNKRASLRAEKTGFVFQQFCLIPYLTVYDNIRLSLLSRKLNGKKQLADELLDCFGLSSRKNHLPEQLSVGERQRVALARALHGRPAIIFADEPTGNLDDTNAGIVLSHLRDFADAGGAVLLVTHDARAMNYADRTYTIETGRIRN